MPARTSGKEQLLRTVVALFGLCMLAAGQPAHAVEVYPEDSVKAAYLLRFAGYVEWPRRAEPHSHFVIAVLGANDMATQLQQLAAGRQLLGTPVRVLRVASVQEASDAHILYVGRDFRGNLRISMRPLAGLGVLVVTDDRHGLAAGSAINFLVADERVRFEVSLAAARRDRLRISSDLLSVAARVTQ